MSVVQVTYEGHSCFLLEQGGYRTVLDPYADGMVPGLPPLRLEAEAVYCSHEHDDHHNLDAVKLVPTSEPAPYTVEEFETTHDNAGGSLRGMNTVRIFHFDNLRIAHLGDLGRPLTPEEQNRLWGVDLLLLPVGGFYTIDAREAGRIVEQVRPRIVVPMHYRTKGRGFPEISELEDFTSQFANVHVKTTAVLLLNKQMPSKIIVMQPAPLL